MTVTALENWNPSSENDKLLKEALTRLSVSTNPLLLSPAEKLEKEEEEKKFILQGKSYFALKAYVMTGKKFPVSEDAFDKEISKTAFKRLDAIDPDIYKQTKEGLVMMGKTCSEFYDDKLHRMVNAGSLAVTWSETTLGLLKKTPGFNLYAQLMVLSDLKYKTPADKDEAFTKAFNAAHTSLQLLQSEAEDGKTQAQDILKDLLKFRDDTKELAPKMKHLIKQYDKGPAENKSNETKPYLEFLREDFKKSSDDLDDLIKKYNSAYESWKTMTGLSVGIGVTIGWIPVFGWVPFGFLVANAVELRDKWEKLESQCKKLREENDEEFKLITWVQMMVKQFDGIEKMIDDAISAVGVLSNMFEEQGASYELIRKSLNQMDFVISAEDAQTRKDFIEAKLDETIRRLNQLQNAGAGFVKAIINEDENVLG